MGRKKITGDEKTVRISQGLLEQVDGYLDSDDAKRLGLDSKVDVVNEAIRQYLQERGFLSPEKLKSDGKIKPKSDLKMTETVRVNDDLHVELLKIAGELQATDGKARSAQDAIKWLVQRWQQQRKK